MTDAPTMLTIMAGSTCIGFLMRRGARGFEAYADDAQTSLGTFPTADEAAGAVIKAAGGAAR